MERKFRSILPRNEQAVNVYNRIGKQWMLITAENEGKPNTMTASWGSLGILWNKPVATVYIRPQRFTFPIVDNNKRLSLSFLSEEHREALKICGTLSGRDTDKFAAAGIKVAHRNGVPYIAESETVMICKKLYADDLREECFTDDEPITHYKDKDFHKFFICEIEEILVAE